MTDETLDYRSPEWVAEQLGIDKNTVYKYLQDGVIPALQLGRKWLISEKDLFGWLAEETQRQTVARRQSAQSIERTSKKLGNMDSEAKNVVKSAHSEARRYDHLKLHQGHLLLALGDIEEISHLMKTCNVDLGALRNELEKNLPQGNGIPARRLGRSQEAKEAMKSASSYAADEGRAQMTTLDLLYGLVASPDSLLQEVLSQSSLTETTIKEMSE